MAKALDATASEEKMARPTARETRSWDAALVARGRGQLTAGQVRAAELLEKYDDRPLLEVGLGIYQRDREMAEVLRGLGAY